MTAVIPPPPSTWNWLSFKALLYEPCLDAMIPDGLTLNIRSNPNQFFFFVPETVSLSPVELKTSHSCSLSGRFFSSRGVSFVLSLDKTESKEAYFQKCKTPFKSKCNLLQHNFFPKTTNTFANCLSPQYNLYWSFILYEKTNKQKNTSLWSENLKKQKIGKKTKIIFFQNFPLFFQKAARGKTTHGEDAAITWRPVFTRQLRTR